MGLGENHKGTANDTLNPVRVVNPFLLEIRKNWRIFTDLPLSEFWPVDYDSVAETEYSVFIGAFIWNFNSPRIISRIHCGRNVSAYPAHSDRVVQHFIKCPLHILILLYYMAYEYFFPAKRKR